MNRSSSFALGLLMAGCMVSIPLSAAPPPACDPDNGGITLPLASARSSPSTGWGPARHLVVAPNGDVYVALQTGRDGGGGVVALRDTKGTATST